MKKPCKEYTNGEITVEWRPELCCHSAICLNDLPDVFDMSKKPWINMSHASTEDIINTVESCPSGALRWRYNEENEPSDI